MDLAKQSGNSFMTCASSVPLPTPEGPQKMRGRGLDASLFDTRGRRKPATPIFRFFFSSSDRGESRGNDANDVGEEAGDGAGEDARIGVGGALSEEDDDDEEEEKVVTVVVVVEDDGAVIVNDAEAGGERGGSI